MSDHAAREISRVITHESEVLVHLHEPSDPRFSIRLLGDHLNISTAAYFSCTADQLRRISEIFSEDS
jgi:hypothetical protein